MRSVMILFAFVMQAHAEAFVARRLFDDLAGRQRGDSWKQTGREQKEGGQRTKREWEESRQRPMMTPIFDERHQGYEGYCDRTISRTGNRPHPAVLTSQIKQARTIQTLLRTYSAQESHLNHIHLSACWTSLGRLAGSWAQRAWLQKNVGAL